MEKEMATNSSTLAWKIPWMEEPGRLQSMGSQRVDTSEQLLWFTDWEVIPDDTTLMAEREEELKNLLMRVKEKSKKVVLKLNIQKIKMMASSLIT